MSVFLYGLKLRNYRGIGETPQRVGPFKKCNFFIGTNNSGKSCVLNFISSHLSQVSATSRDRTPRLSLSPLEVHLGATEAQVEIGLAIPLDSSFQCIAPGLNRSSRGPSGSVDVILSNLLRKLSDKDLIWVDIKASDTREYKFSKGSLEEIRELIHIDDWYILWNSITNQSGGDLMAHWIPQVIDHLLNRLKPGYPAAKIIPAKRQIGTKGGAFDDFSGAGLIDKLAELQNPGPTERNLRKSFDKINAFLQEVAGDHTAMIEIPHDRTEVLVHKEGRVLPLSSLGTGIHEVVMIAAFCTLENNSIVCIEEPEIHLHPLLQRKLIRYITTKTDNQYFIATHSASIIDQAAATVFHVTQQNHATRIDLATAPGQRFQVCQDLGYRASDLLQTNAIIWVEGPSDRIYVKHWIAAVDASLQEGIHYSIMFYGGRLLSHLSAKDQEIEEFIALRRLNRNMSIIIDSDKKNSHSKINETKRRIIEEFSTHSDPAWLTAGREIENYIPPDILEAALSATYSSFLAVESTDRFSHRLHFAQKGKSGAIQTDVDKVKIARVVCETPADLSVLDLLAQVNKIVGMIRKANT